MGKQEEKHNTATNDINHGDTLVLNGPARHTYVYASPMWTRNQQQATKDLVFPNGATGPRNVWVTCC